MNKVRMSMGLLVNICFLSTLFASNSFAERVAEPLQMSQSRTEKYEKLRREDLTMSFSFYGKVVDLDGNPVPSTRVLLDIRFIPMIPTMNDTKRIEVFTDSQGRFLVERDGFLLSLEGVEKEGYEYHFRYNPKRGFIFSKQKKKAELGQLPDQPVVFKVRKKGTPTLVLNGSARFGLQPGDVAFFDLLWKQWCYPNRLQPMSQDYKGWHPDLKVSLEGDRKNPRVVLETMSSDTGIVVDERELYEAPQQGYRPKVVLPFTEFEKGNGFHTYAYIKGRGGKFYSQVRVEAGVGDREDPEKRFAKMNLLYTTNPNGEGNFESDSELMHQYQEDVSSRKRRPYGYDPTAKPYTIEDVRKLLGK